MEIDLDVLEGDIGVITPRGRLNAVSARRFTEVLATAVEGGQHRVVVDLAETTFLDSSGLGALIAGLKTTRRLGGDLRLARPTPDVMDVLEVTNLNRILRPRDSVDSAFDD